MRTKANETKEYARKVVKRIVDYEQGEAQQKALFLEKRIDKINFRKEGKREQFLNDLHDLEKTNDCDTCSYLNGADVDIRKMWYKK